MRTALDSNILSAIWSAEESSDTLSQHVSNARQAGAIVLSPIALSELLAHPRVSPKAVRSLLERASVQIDFDLSEDVWMEAGIRYAQYAERKRKAVGELPKRVLPDFVVGAHALLQTDRLMTMDVQRYRTYFPKLVLYEV